MSELTPEELKRLYDEGVDCFNEGNYVKADSLLREFSRHRPQLADVHNKLGIIANLEDNLEDAAKHFEQAVKQNPNYTEASLNLAITLNDLGRTDESSEVFARIDTTIADKSTGLDPFAAGKIANEHFKLGNLYQEFGMRQEAVEEYRKALKLKPMADVMTRLGVSLRDMGENEAAVEELKRAVELNPAYLTASVQLGLTLYVMGSHDEAFALWEEALKKNPEMREPRSFLNMFRKEG